MLPPADSGLRPPLHLRSADVSIPIRPLAAFPTREMIVGVRTTSPAWQSLSLAARCGYLELLSIYNGRNNGNIALSARGLAERLRISRATAARAINDLTARGFIEATRVGGFSLKSGKRRATEWRLNRYKCDLTGQLPSQQYMRWKDGKIYFTVSPASHDGLTTGWIM